MEQLINDIIEFLLPQNDLFLYIFMFLSAIVENLFPPIPGDTITALGAFLVGTGRLQYLPVFIATTVGSVIGFMLLFYLGRFLEREFFMNKNYKIFSTTSIISAEHWFKKYGYFVVLANRFLPGVRSVISLVSGISKLNPLKVAALALISASVWNLIWIQVGFLLGNNWQIVREKTADIIGTYNIGAGIAIIILVLAYISFRFLKKRNSMRKKNAGE